MNAARRLPWLAVLAAAWLAPAEAAHAAPSRWSAAPGRSRITVHVYKKGFLSGMAHDHHFAAGSFRVTAMLDGAAPDQARVEVTIAAGSLRDQQPDLSDEDRAKVDAQAAGADVLDAAHFPEIRFAPEGPAGSALRLEPDGSLDGELAGTLSLRGKQHPVAVRVHATKEGEAWHARGSARFKQSDFGIEPYSGFLGAVAVHDEILVEYDLVLDQAG
jgi:polyisoprenoid-binding protein YceI